MNRLETYKEIYQKEIERRSQLNTDLSIPVGLISILSTGIFFYITNFNFAYNIILDCLFIILVLIGSYFLIKSIIFLLKSYLLLTKNVEYNYLAYPNEIDNYYQEFKKYYISIGKTEQESTEKAAEDLEKYFIEGYIRTATKNMAINDERSTNLFRCKEQLLRSLILLLFAFVPFLITFFNKEDKIIKYQISTPVQIKFDSCINFKNEINMPKATEDSTPPPKPPTPPTPPQDRIIKEDVIPVKPKSGGGNR